MLTFRFTGADGRMIVSETLTSGMVGKEVRLEFSEDWEDLSKTAVFMAGSVTRDVVGVSDLVTIPAVHSSSSISECCFPGFDPERNHCHGDGYRFPRPGRYGQCDLN